MHVVITTAFHVVIALAILGTFLAVAAAVGAYLVPRIRLVARSELSRGGIAECCPPGSGCNDPHPKYRKCLRTEARRIARVDELLRLEETWSRFCGVPRRSRKERAQARAEYAAVRDGIVTRALRDVEDEINSGRHAQLPQHLTAGSEVVDGPVMNPRSR